MAEMVVMAVMVLMVLMVVADMEKVKSLAPADLHSNFNKGEIQI